MALALILSCSDVWARLVDMHVHQARLHHEIELLCDDRDGGLACGGAIRAEARLADDIRATELLYEAEGCPVGGAQ